MLGLFGVDNFTEVQREEILKAITAVLDEICKAAASGKTPVTGFHDSQNRGFHGTYSEPSII